MSATKPIMDEQDVERELKHRIKVKAELEKMALYYLERGKICYAKYYLEDALADQKEDK